MPPRRSTRGNVQEKDNGQSAKTNSSTTDNAPQKTVILMKEHVLTKKVTDNTHSPVFCQLKHPKTEQGAMFLFSAEEADVYEIQSFNEQFRSWIIDSSVYKDGKMLFTTPIDPLFLVLPYLQKVEKSGKFMTLDQIIVDESYPECRRLNNTTGMLQMQEITDVKGDDSFKAYRFNKEKTMLWLKKKATKLANKLEEKDICVGGSSHSLNFIKSKKGSVTTSEDFIRFAHGVISDYLSEELSASLRDFMNIPILVPKKDVENEEPPAKRQKTEKTEPVDDYSNQKSKTKTLDENKLTVAQKKLSQVDKKGMKSISSFFSPKGKS